MTKILLEDNNFIFGIEDIFRIDNKSTWKSFFVHTRENSNAEKYGIYIHLVASVFESDENERNRVSCVRISSNGFEDMSGISISGYVEALKETISFADKIVLYFASRGEKVRFNRDSKKYRDYICQLRVDHGEVLGDMAKMLDVSLPKLSAVENGEQEVPLIWVNMITRHYDLSYTEAQTLMELAEKHNKDVKYRQEMELWR